MISRHITPATFGYSAHTTGTIDRCYDGRNRYEGEPNTDCNTQINQPGYDDHGNMTSSGTGDSFEYDELNRLTETPDGETLLYGADGQLAQYDGTRHFQYDTRSGPGTGGANIGAEWTSTWHIKRRFVHDGGLGAPIVDYDGAGTALRVWYLTDERGSVMARTNDGGNVFGINTYDEYGNEPALANSGWFGYAGMLRMDNGTLTHNRNRAYHPGFGRFLQMDPIGQAGGLNVYAYVGGDPVNYVDPLGLRRAKIDCKKNPQDCVKAQCIGWCRLARRAGAGGQRGGRNFGCATCGNGNRQGPDPFADGSGGGSGDSESCDSNTRISQSEITGGRAERQRPMNVLTEMHIAETPNPPPSEASVFTTTQVSNGLPYSVDVYFVQGGTRNSIANQMISGDFFDQNEAVEYFFDAGTSSPHGDMTTFTMPLDIAAVTDSDYLVAVANRTSGSGVIGFKFNDC